MLNKSPQNFSIMALSIISSSIVSPSSSISFNLLSFFSYPFSISIFIWAYNTLLFPPSHIFFITISLCTCKAIYPLPVLNLLSLSYISPYIFLFSHHLLRMFPHVPILLILTFSLSNTVFYSIIHTPLSVLFPKEAGGSNNSVLQND